jgi:SAM-dependent methyltransferase
MATHQEIGGMSDQDLRDRMVERYAARFDVEYWKFFKANLGRHLSSQPTILDLGCGPGLYLRELSEGHPDSTLYGFDITPAMIEYARDLRYPGTAPTFMLHDLTKDPLPLETETVDLVTMTALLHVLDDPFAVLAEARRVLRPSGFFLVDDWIRTSLSQYLESRGTNRGEEQENRRRWLKLFPFHNKYTVADWKWILAEAGFSLVTTVQLRPNSQIFLATPRR